MKINAPEFQLWKVTGLADGHIVYRYICVYTAQYNYVFNPIYTVEYSGDIYTLKSQVATGSYLCDVRLSLSHLDDNPALISARTVQFLAGALDLVYDNSPLECL